MDRAIWACLLASSTAGIASCFVITAADVREHDAALAPPADTDTDTDTDTDADTDTDTDADTDTDTDTEPVATGDTGPETVELELHGVNFYSYDGYGAVAVVLDAGLAPITAGTATVALAEFTVLFPAGLVAGDYTVDVLIEGNGNAICDFDGQVNEPTYRTWVTVTEGPSQNVRINARTDSEPLACASFP